MDFGRAINSGNVDRVREQLQNGAGNPNQNVVGGGKYKKNIQPLTLAAAMGHVELAKLLLDHGANMNVLSSGYGGHTYTATLVAVRENHFSMVSFLLSRMADPNKYDKRSLFCTPLFVAARNSNMEVVELLLSSPNIDTTIVNENNQTAADVATDDLIKKLIQIKFHEQQRERLCKEVPKLKADSLKLKISEKEKQIMEMSSKAEKLMDEISAKINELEIMRMNISVMECDVIELNEKMAMLNELPKTQVLEVEESLLECPCCMEVRRPSDTVMYQCTSGHPFCAKCAENLNNCPTCRQPLDRNNQTRCLVLEKFISETKIYKPS